MTELKILRVIASLDPASGGPAKHIKSITPLLTQLGVSSTIICLDDPEEAFLKSYEGKIIALGKPISPWKYHPKLRETIIREIPNHNLIVQHGLWLYLGYIIRKIRNENEKLNNPFIIYPHGMLDSFYQTDKGRWLKAIRNYIYFHWIEKTNLLEANALVFTSQAELETHEMAWGKISGPKKVNLGYGISSSFISNKYSTESKTLLSYGRITEKKGFDILLMAWEKLKRTNKTDWKLIVAGPGWNEEYGIKLKNIIRQSILLSESVVCLEQQNEEGINKLFSQCGGYVLWSKHENFAQTVAEALSAGLPVLISTGINIFPLILKSKAGLVGEPNVEGAFETLSHFFKLNPNNLLAYSNNARHCYLNNFQLENYASSFINFINEEILI